MPRFSFLFASFLLAAQSASAGSFQTLYSFSGGDDGQGPYGRLVIDKAGILYGITIGGGTARRGNIYSLDPASGVQTTLYSFTGGADGANPQTGLVSDGKGTLYGVAAAGGLTDHCGLGCGTIFKFSVGTKKFTTLYQFTGLADGAQPFPALRLLAGHLYGSTAYAGTGGGCPSQGCGADFDYSLAAKTLTVLRELTLPDGVLALGQMAAGPGGLLYGTTAEAGPNGSGTVYSLDRSNGVLQVVHGFDYHVDGSGSDADLLIKKNVAYGTERVGGPTDASDGTVYKLDLGTGAVTTLYSFTGQADGAEPSFGVVSGAKGLLYGVAQGGTSGAGTVYSLDPVKLKYTLLHAFAISDGLQPSGGLLSYKGALYGVTSGGGRGAGTVFKLVP
jgi:uncharacterized repeat protein (TIGR03803 family)